MNKRQNAFPSINEDRAFTLIEMLIVMIIVGILASIAIAGFRYYITKAYNITVEHDLKGFVNAQEQYFAGHDRYNGSAGDYIRGGNPVAGSLVSAEFSFRPSDGVQVEILSGDGSDPQGTESFVAQSDHDKASVRCKYDFASGQLTKEDK